MKIKNISNAVLVINGRLVDPQLSVYVSVEKFKQQSNKVLEYLEEGKIEIFNDLNKTLTIEDLDKVLDEVIVTQNSNNTEEEKENYLDIVKETLQEENQTNTTAPEIKEPKVKEKVKPEEPKPEEVKVEEVKTEEPKAEEVKAEEQPKAEEVKVEEPKVKQKTPGRRRNR